MYTLKTKAYISGLSYSAYPAFFTLPPKKREFFAKIHTKQHD